MHWPRSTQQRLGHGKMRLQLEWLQAFDRRHFFSHYVFQLTEQGTERMTRTNHYAVPQLVTEHRQHVQCVIPGQNTANRSFESLGEKPLRMARNETDCLEMWRHPGNISRGPAGSDWRLTQWRKDQVKKPRGFDDILATPERFWYLNKDPQPRV
jgi:hypothetical protein